jgi:uncharacterized protein (DUF1778 family)
MAKKRRGMLIKREKRVAARITKELYQALEKRAFQEHKTMTTLVIEAIMKYLDFKMPERSGKK